MYLLFEEAGKFLTGRVLSQTDASTHAELASGKRVKVKASHVLLQFEQPEPAELMAAAQAVASEFELDLAWEFAPLEEFGFADLARDYFSSQASLSQQIGVLLALFEAPHYFRRAGKGRFRKASQEVLAQALAAIEKKKKITLQIEIWAKELSQGRCPDAICEQLYKILFKPDKNAPEYKAVVQAAQASQLGPLPLLIKAGAIDSPYQFHWRRFVLEHFPQGTALPPFELAPIADELPLAPASAFSIDDSDTTEIDDALSLQGLGNGTVRLGIHIAVPGLAIAPGSAIDQLARARLSTVYMPGHKITMLPDAVVQAYTLTQGRHCPALSLYVQIDEATLAIDSRETVLERIFIDANLRYDQLDDIVTSDWLQGTQGTAAALETTAPELACKREQLAFLYRLATALKARREAVRGKPEIFNQADYNYRLLPAPDRHSGQPGSAQDDGAPTGCEQVQISQRRRGTPLDLIVSEAMILANSSWGAWLAELGVPGIYRSQASLAPGVKVRMGLRALAHAGIGVASYAWSSSPLRRYVDLLNQWQIIACVRHGQMAALAAPFKPKDIDLLAIVSSFDAAYSAYADFQRSMERFWVLQYIKQQGMVELQATVLRDGLVRANNLPLVLLATGGQDLPRGAQVLLRLGQVDDISLTIEAVISARLEQAAGAQDTAGQTEVVADAEQDDAADEVMTGPLVIALEIDTDSAAPDPAEKDVSL